MTSPEIAWCEECEHSEPHTGGGIGICLHPKCGCDGPTSDIPVLAWITNQPPSPYRSPAEVKAGDTTVNIVDVWDEALESLQHYRGPGGFLTHAQPGDAASAVLQVLIDRGILSPVDEHPG